MSSSSFTSYLSHALIFYSKYLKISAVVLPLYFSQHFEQISYFLTDSYTLLSQVFDCTQL